MRSPSGTTALLARRGRPDPAVVAPLALLALLFARHWLLMGDYPTGIDPGNWLAFGAGLFGDGGKSSASAYPPLVPAAMHLGSRLADPMLVAKLVGIGSIVAVVGATYVVARAELGTWFALAAAALPATASVVMEPVAFGGYPQGYALAAMVGGVWLQSRYLESGSGRAAAGAAAALVAVAVTHHGLFPLALAAYGIAWSLWALSGREPRPIARRAATTAAIGAAGLLAFAPTFVAFSSSGYSPPINSGGIGIADALRQAFGGAQWLWIGVSVGGLSFLAIGSRRPTTLWLTAASLCTASLVMFLPTHEVRLLPPYTVGVALAAVLAGSELWRHQLHRAWSPAVWAVVVAAPLAAWPAVDAHAGGLYDYYRVADGALEDTASWLDEYGGEEGVVVRRSRHGWPLGWWFEGLTRSEVIVDSSSQWLGFEDERSNASLATRFSEPGVSAGDARQLAREHGVRLLVVLKREWIGWSSWLSDPDGGVSVAYENERYLVLDVADDP